MAKKPIVEPESCGGCRFYLGNKTDDCGYCRRYPPVAIAQEDTAITILPVVEASEWCGEFSRKLNS